MEFKILGPLEVVDDGHRVDLGGAKQRALLAVLLLEANTVVSSDRLIDALWDESPPAQPRKTLQVYVSQLRKAVGTDRIETRSPGYLVRVADDELDLHRVEQLASRGEFGQALALFRGRPLAEFESERFASVEVARLDELRLTCIEGRIEADLAAGRHGALVGELDSLVREQPLRERLRAQLMLALYRSGRQAEALEAFQAARRALVDELGIEPSRSLRDLHQAILRQDVVLDLDAAREEREEKPDVQAATPPPTPTPASEREPRAERKTVTAIHVRVAIASEHGGHLDPEVLRSVLSRAFGEITRAIEAHGGTVDAIGGDSVGGVFGLPVVHEDDPLRAARATEEVQRGLTQLAAELESESDARLDFRIGVSTGEVMTGGADGRLRATGEPLTRSARLSQDAAPHGLLFDELTSRAIASPRRDIGRFQSPMVGRERERRRLEDAFEQAAGDSSCQLFTILGAAGVGKSRLVQEFLGDLAGRGHVARGRCLPYGEGITFWPVLEALRDIGGLEESDSPEEAVARLAAAVDDEDDAELVAQRITDVVGLTEGGSRVEDGFEALRTYLELVATREPLVVVFDDVHWGEETFHELVEHIAEWSRGAPLLLLCMARPELLDSRPTWGGGKLNATSALLEPLSDAESAELVANLVGEATLAEEVRERIASAAEGNPLFVEEMLSMLIDEGVLVRDADRWAAVRDLAAFPVPPTIQALLAARLDQLGEEERIAIESAAVEGKVFHETSVLELSQSRETAAALTSLMRKELIRAERPVFAGERAFRFRHLMIRDAAYDAIPKERRAVLHERHVAWLEQRTGEHSGEFDEIVGYHLEQAYRFRDELGHRNEEARMVGRRAAERLGAAGRRAFARLDAPAAMNLLSRATALLASDDPLRVDLIPNVRAIQGAADVGWADAILQEAIRSGDARLRAHALVQHGFLQLFFHDSDVAPAELIEVAESAIAVFENKGDDLGLARAWRLIGQAQYLARSARMSAAAAETALAFAQRSNDPSEQLEILEWLGIALQLGPTTGMEGEAICRRLLDGVGNDPRLRLTIIGTLAYMVGIQGRAAEADELVGHGRRIEHELQEVTWLFPVLLAFYEAWVRDPVAAEGYLRPVYEGLKKIGEQSNFCSISTMLAQAVYAQARYDEAEELSREAERSARPNDIHSHIIWRGTRAKVLARRGELQAAESLAREAVDYAETSDFLHSHADALTDLAEVLALAGRRHEAASAIEKAIALHEQKGNVLAVAQTRALLENLPQTYGRA